jgi:hypothetical protein
MERAEKIPKNEECPDLSIGAIIMKNTKRALRAELLLF